MAKFKREGEMLIHQLVSLAQILGAETHFKMELSFPEAGGSRGGK